MSPPPPTRFARVCLMDYAGYLTLIFSSIVPSLERELSALGYPLLKMPPAVTASGSKTCNTTYDVEYVNLVAMLTLLAVHTKAGRGPAANIMTDRSRTSIQIFAGMSTPTTTETFTAATPGNTQI
ncbi:hypothetical protein PG996_003495 [Apiospora saccharicola]|uniref:Uncharacterized protein n=1 Tax=Apiospora saccharicola TaxID=335842 RepID=A0ABR1W1F3_9PEZI